MVVLLKAMKFMSNDCQEIELTGVSMPAIKLKLVRLILVLQHSIC